MWLIRYVDTPRQCGDDMSKEVLDRGILTRSLLGIYPVRTHLTYIIAVFMGKKHHPGPAVFISRPCELPRHPGVGFRAFLRWLPGTHPNPGSLLQCPAAIHAPDP